MATEIDIALGTIESERTHSNVIFNQHTYVHMYTAVNMFDVDESKE